MNEYLVKEYTKNILSDFLIDIIIEDIDYQEVISNKKQNEILLTIFLSKINGNNIVTGDIVKLDVIWNYNSLEYSVINSEVINKTKFKNFISKLIKYQGNQNKNVFKQKYEYLPDILIYAKYNLRDKNLSYLKIFENQRVGNRLKKLNSILKKLLKKEFRFVIY